MSKRKRVRPPPRPPDPPFFSSQFVAVNTRLYREDVEKLQKEAADAGELNWQPRLRKLVHEALNAPSRRIVR